MTRVIELPGEPPRRPSTVNQIDYPVSEETREVFREFCRLVREGEPRKAVSYLASLEGYRRDALMFHARRGDL